MYSERLVIICQKIVANVNIKRVAKNVLEDLDVSTGKKLKKLEIEIEKEKRKSQHVSKKRARKRGSLLIFLHILCKNNKNIGDSS